MKHFTNFKNGLIKESPVFSLYLGLCSVLAVSTTINNAIGMSVSVIFVLILSNVAISFLRKIIPDEVRIPVYIVIIATLVTVVQMLLDAFSPSLSASLGAFIALIVVNCIILGRAEAFASKNNVIDSFLDGLGMGIGYSICLISIAVIREMLATGGLEFVNPLTNQVVFSFKLIPQEFVINLFHQPFGAFITFACMAALFAYINGKRKGSAK